MRTEQEWNAIRNKLNGEMYDWDTCFENAKKRRNRHLILKYVGGILLLLIICSILCYVVYPEKVYENIYGVDEMVVYVDDEPQRVKHTEKMVEVSVAPDSKDGGEFELVLPRRNSMVGLWQIEEATEDVEVVSSEQIWDGKGRLGVMMGAYHAVQRMRIGVAAGTEGTIRLKVEFSDQSQDQVTIHYVCK